MTKSKTWKAARDLRNSRRESGAYVGASELKDIILAAEYAGWEYGLADYVDAPDGSNGMITMMRDCDECAALQFPVWNGFLTKKESLELAREAIKNPPPPRLRTAQECYNKLLDELFSKAAYGPSDWPSLEKSREEFIVTLTASLKKMGRSDLLVKCQKDANARAAFFKSNGYYSDSPAYDVDDLS